MQSRFGQAAAPPAGFGPNRFVGPGAGSGGILLRAAHHFKRAELIGVELDPSGRGDRLLATSRPRDGDSTRVARRSSYAHFGGLKASRILLARP